MLLPKPRGVLYDFIKLMPFDSLRESFNLIVSSDAREGWEHYFTFNTDSSINTEKAVFLPRFVAETAADGNLSITNVSLIETTAGAGAYLWIYDDNSPSAGPNPNRTIAPNEDVTLIIDNGMGTKDTLTGTESILACRTDNFTITYLPNNQVRFELPGFIPGNPSNIYNIRWIFSDGTTSTSNPVVKTFTSNGTVTCQLLHINSGEVACQFTKPYLVKCGDKKTHNETFIFTQSGQKWKLDGSIWVKTSEVGSKVKYLKRVGFVWLPANNQGACADLSGTYIREVYNPNKNCIDVNAAGSRCLGNGTFPTSVSHTIPEVSNVFSKPGQLSAGLGIMVNGIWRGWGYAGKPRLILP